MRRAPWAARALAIFLIAVAASFPLQVMYLYGHGITEVGAVLSKLTLLNYLSILCCLVSASLVWDVHRISLATLLITGVVISWNNYLVGYVGYDYSMMSTFFGTSLFVLSYSLLLHPKARQSLLKPDTRWWLQAERRVMSLPTEIHTVRGDFGALRTFDLSESGAFVGCDEQALGKLAVGDYCSLNIRISEYKRVKCMAKIVRVSEGNVGKYPKGIGLHFEDVEPWDLKQIKTVLQEGPPLR